jgi:hypothetical protein
VEEKGKEIINQEIKDTSSDHASDDGTITELSGNSLFLQKSDKNNNFYVFVIPIILFLFLGLSLFHNGEKNNFYQESDLSGFIESGDAKYFKSQSKFNILSQEDLSKGVKDTVYTTFDCWLELRIDQQTVYQHFRNGKVLSYPISSGNKYLNRSVESRPGLFAIFFKNAHHQSSQYNNADMYDFMPFNQGIGFHSLDGTGYYGSLGKAPSSHGCIRMRHQDAQKLFNDCPLGTLVLAHKGYSSRVIGFADENYKNEKEYSKDEYKTLLAANLYNVLEGKYYIAERKFFVVNPDIIPKSGIYIAYDKQIPEIQLLPKSTFRFVNINDRLNNQKSNYRFEIPEKQITENNFEEIEVSSSESNPDDLVVANVDNDIPMPKDELIKKFFSNPIGVLPYFPPVNQ